MKQLKTELERKDLYLRQNTKRKLGETIQAHQNFVSGPGASPSKESIISLSMFAHNGR